MAFAFNPFTGKLDITPSLSSLDSRYVNITGDTMTGALVVENDLTVGKAGDVSWSFGFEDNTLGDFTTTGDALWAVQSTTKRTGTYAVKSGTLSDGQRSSLTLAKTLTYNSKLSFYYKVQTEAIGDTVALIVDGVYKASFAGDVDWTLYSLWLSAGAHTIEFRFARDIGGSYGANACWLDDFTITTYQYALKHLNSLIIGSPTLSNSAVEIEGDVNVTGSYRVNGSPLISTPGQSYYSGIGAGGATKWPVYNTAIGYYAAYGSGATGFIGNGDVFVGTYAGRDVTTSFWSTVVGEYAGSEITSGGFNTFMGSFAGQKIAAGERNAFFGYAAGAAYTSSANRNTVVGSHAAYVNVSAGTNNTFIGYASVPTSDVSHSVSIGSYTKCTANNQMVVGSDDGAGRGQLTDSYWGSGVVKGTPLDFTFNASGGSGTNIAGASLIIAGGKGTGNAATGGAIVFKTSDTGTSGTTAQTLSEKLRITKAGDIQFRTTTGTKIGTATNELIGFYNSTPIVQPLATTDLGTVLSDLGLRAVGTAYPLTTTGAVDFGGGAVFNEAGEAAVDFRVESDTEANMLYLDANGDTDGALYLGGSTNGVKINKGGEMSFIGTATVWDDLRVTPGSFDRPGASDPTIKAVTPGGGAITTYLYEFAKDNIASFTVQLPHSYKQGEDIKVHIHWTPGTRGSEENGNTVGWKIDYSWANINGTFGAMATADLSDACNGVDWEHNMTPDVTLTGSGKNISSMLICNVKRTDTGTDDTWVSTTTGKLPYLLEIDFHFPMDTVGSKESSSK